MSTIGKVGVVVGATLVSAGVLSAQGAVKRAAPAAASKHVMVMSSDIKWGPAPPGLPPGAQAAVIEGDPAGSGYFAIRAKMPDGYVVPPHSHPTDEHLTILSGTLMAGMGDKLDAAGMRSLTAGSYATMPAGENHFVKAKGETVIQVTGMGPFAIKYVNAADDPRIKKTN
jgi:quercetin dioxygenase-like cupin family protein